MHHVATRVTRTRDAVLGGLLLLCATAGVACLWDHDTLMMERQRFPSALELITGKFWRHSSDFYEWRVGDRQRRLVSEPHNLALLDDIAVAYDKLGRRDEALEWIGRKETMQPGSYETIANRGTILIHRGDLEAGLRDLERAIEINPQAHFGREIYQAEVVRYILSRRVDGKLTLPLRRGNEGFAEFLTRKQDRYRALSGKDRDAAVKGILGMMRFGDHTSPVLLESLGDLLSSGGPKENASALASRAYLKASYQTVGTPAAAAYRQLAANAGRFEGNRYPPLAEIEAQFKRELADASSWYDALVADERRWIASAADPEAEFARKYVTEPSVIEPSVIEPKRRR